MLDDGPILAQPAKIMKALAILSDQMVKCDEEKRDTARRKEQMRREAEAQAKAREARGGGR